MSSAIPEKFSFELSLNCFNILNSFWKLISFLLIVDICSFNKELFSICFFSKKSNFVEFVFISSFIFLIEDNISAKQIHEELVKLGYNIDKKKIIIDSPIDTLGNHIIEIELHKKVKANINIKVSK